MPQNNWDVSSGRTCCQCVLPDFCQGGLHMLDSGIQPGRKKADKIYNWLRAYIDENKFSSNQRLPSENELCRRLDVSRETVRAAMARLVEENLVTRVKGSGTYINKDAAVSGPARSLNAEYKIGLILQGQDSHANSRLIDGIRDVMSDTDVDLQIFFTDNKFSNERNCLDVVAHQGFDGFIVDGVKASLLNPNLDCYRNIFAKKIPVIFYNNYYKELNYPRVINNDYKCARELIGLLTRAGHKKIAGIFVYDNYQSIEKFRGYVGSLRSAGLKFEDDYIKWCISYEAHADGFYKEIGKFLKGLPIPLLQDQSLKRRDMQGRDLRKRLVEQYEPRGAAQDQVTLQNPPFAARHRVNLGSEQFFEERKPFQHSSSAAGYGCSGATR